MTTSTSSTPRPSPNAFAAFVGDQVLRQAVTEGAERSGLSPAGVQDGDIASATESLAGVATPKRLLIDLGDCRDPFVALDRLAGVCDQGTRVVLFGAENDVRFYRDLLAAGIEDYLVKPVTADDVAALFARLADVPAVQESEDGDGRVIVVVGARGGVGATTIASNLAWILAQDRGQRTALVDLDLLFGTCAVGFDLQPSGGLREALANAARIDELFVERAMLKVTDTLWLLAQSDEMVETEAFDPAALRRLIETLRRAFDYVVLDLPRFAARTHMAMIEPPLSVALISEPSLGGLRDTVKLRGWFEKLVPEASVHVALNRMGATPGAELSAKDFETSANLKLACQIPLETRSAAAAIVECKPVVHAAPRGKAARALQELATTIAGEPVSRAGQPVWRRIVKGRR